MKCITLHSFGECKRRCWHFPCDPRFPLDTSLLHCVFATPVEQICFTIVNVSIPTMSAAHLLFLLNADAGLSNSADKWGLPDSRENQLGATMQQTCIQWKLGVRGWLWNQCWWLTCICKTGRKWVLKMDKRTIKSHQGSSEVVPHTPLQC